MHVKSLVRTTLKIKQDFDLSTQLIDLGATNEQLRALQKKFVDTYNKTVPVVKFSDTVHTLTDSLNKAFNPLL